MSDSKEMQIIPPARLPADAHRPNGYGLVSVSRVNPGGIINSTITRWEANRHARTINALSNRVRAETELFDAQTQALGSYIKRQRAFQELQELPEILANDRECRRAERAERLRQYQGRKKIKGEKVEIEKEAWACKMQRLLRRACHAANRARERLHGKAKRALQDIWMAETKNEAVAALDAFAQSYAPKYDKAAECLTKDRDALLAFYDFPAEHSKHLRSTNPIESTFATVRHRTIRSKGCLSNKTALAMVFKLIDAAQKSWRCLDGHNQLPKLITGVKFADGIEVAARPAAPQAKAA